MTGFHIWNPAYVSDQPLVLETHITAGESMVLGRGSDAFVRAALSAIGIDLAAPRWELEVMRTHYFSSYRRDPGDWRNAWDLAWRLRVELDRVLPIEPVSEFGCYDLDAVDESFDLDDRPDGWADWSCLVLADFDDPMAGIDARRLAVDRSPGATVTTGLAFERLPQLRCDLGMRPRSFYEQGAGEAEDLLRALQERGASVHQEETLERLRRSAAEGGD